MSSKQHPTYSTAKTADQIIEAVARAAWWNEHGSVGCPPDKIPTEADLCEHVAVEGGALIGGALDAPRLLVEIDPVEYAEPLAPARETQQHAGTAAGGDVSVPRVRPPLRRFMIPEDAHAWWLTLPERQSEEHPLLSLVRAWQGRPALVEHEARRDKAIVPKVEAGTIHPDRQHGMLFGGLTDGRKPPETQLPLLPELSHRNRVGILDIVDATGVPIMAKGRGAPLALRFGIRSLLTVKPNDRRHDSVRVALTLGELAAGLYAGRWRNQHWPKLRNVLLEARNYGMLINGGRSLWFPWAVRQLPAEHAPSIDDLVVIDLAFPPGSAEGPLIDLAALDQLGVESAPRYRAYLAVYSLNWQKGVTRVPVDKRRGQWRWAMDASKYPVLMLDERRRLAFGEGDRKHRTTAEIDAAFENLPGLIVADKQAKDARNGVIGWRVIPAEAVDVTRGK